MASVAKREWTHKGETKTAWVVRYTDQGGKRRMKTFEKKKDADRYRSHVENEIERGEHVASSSSGLVRDMADRFIDHCERRFREGTLSHATLYQRKGMVRLYITPKLGSSRISDLTFEQVDNFRIALIDAGLGPRRVRGILQTLKQVEEFARKRRYTAKHIVSDVLADNRTVGILPIKVMSAQEVRALIDTVGSPMRWWRERHRRLVQLAVHFAAFCGLRFGEIRGLKIENIDTRSRIVHVRHSLQQWTDELKAPKTRAGVRDVPIPAHLASLIDEWMARDYVENPRSLLLTNTDGRCVLQASLSNSYRKLQTHAGIWKREDGKAYHFHALRHFAASFLIANGMPAPDVAELLGHESFDLTLRVYAHPVMSGRVRGDAFDRNARLLLGTGATTEQHKLISA